MVAALGGMLVSGGIYIALNFGKPGFHGWGIPMATDIAFAVGCMMILGDRVFNALKIFLIALTIFDDVFMGSMMAFRENHLKKRLAYSSVSQVSYILFGIIALNPMGFTGSILHIFAHAFIKNTLFLCAGAIIYKTHHVYVSDLKGIGKEMPVTMWCFTIASLALVGIPPLSGFVSKYYLAISDLSLNNTLGVVGVAI